jgi:hypothetical protein
MHLSLHTDGAVRDGRERERGKKGAVTAIYYRQGAQSSPEVLQLITKLTSVKNPVAFLSSVMPVTEYGSGGAEDKLQDMFSFAHAKIPLENIFYTGKHSVGRSNPVSPFTLAPSS